MCVFVQLCMNISYVFDNNVAEAIYKKLDSFRIMPCVYNECVILNNNLLSHLLFSYRCRMLQLLFSVLHT